MLFGKREPRSLDARRRGGYRPEAENLEGRQLLSIDLGGVPPGTGSDTSPTRTTPLPAITGDSTSPSPTQAYGVNMASTLAGLSAGFSVSNVGDVNGDTYDDFVIGAPSVATAGGSTGPNAATAYLVFGSATATSGTISDWLNINANFGNTGVGRVGNLNQLGNSIALQQDPYNGLGVDSNNVQLSYPFAGIKFVTTQTPGSELGESSSAAIGVNLQNGFLLGAPGPHDPVTTTTGSGRAFLISGGQNLNALIGRTIDLDNLGSAGISGVNITTFTNTEASARTGQGLAGIGNFFADGFNSLAIGAPDASISGVNSGAVYVVDGAGLQQGISTYDLSLVGQDSSHPGQIFVGAAAGDQSGWSLAGPGDVDGSTTSSGQLVTDLLIGAPSNNVGSPGSAFLVYGANTFTNQIITVGGRTVLPLSKVNAPSTATPPDLTIIRGLRVTGTTGGDQTGWVVAGAGDFNADGLPDIMVGSPSFRTFTGRVDLFYGQSINGTNPLQGSITLGAVPATVVNATFVGGAIGDLAGYAISQTGKMASLTIPGNPILIGAPGFDSGAGTGGGTVYILPPNDTTLTGSNSLLTAEAQPLAATQLVFTTPGTNSPPFFGASVSGRVLPIGTSQNHTADSDLLGDFIIGSPNYQPLVTGTGRAGGGLILEGAFIPLKTPSAITATLGGVDTFGTFTNINPSTPNTMTLYVESNAKITPAFDPVTQIDPATVTVNGVAFPNATVTKDPIDENGDGIEDAIITITPRSNIGLTTSTTTLTVSGRTKATGPNANQRWIAAAAISVAGGGGGGGQGGGALAGAFPIGLIRKTKFIAPFGPDRYTPTLQALSGLTSYKAIPYRVAVQQYLPQPGFADRLVRYYYPKLAKRQTESPNPHSGRRTSTLGSHVFTRGKWHAGDVKTFTHKQPVVPVTLQTERLGGQPRGYTAKKVTPRLK
jgi:FG-GAP repeat